jgi:hypothetical protein
LELEEEQKELIKAEMEKTKKEEKKQEIIFKRQLIEKD